MHSRRSTYERRAVMSDVRRTPALFGSRTVPAAKPATAHKPAVVRSRPKPTPSRQERSSVLMRQLVSAKQHRRSARGRHSVRGIALVTFASILFVFGIGVGLVQLKTNKDVKAQVQTLAAQADQSADGTLPDGALPSENRPAGGGYWQPTAKEPKRIKISKLGVNARVLKMGVKPNGEIKTPNNIFDTGWLETSAKPGEHGAMFIDGHVHGPTLPGVFVGIKNLQPGDKIQIERGDGKMFTYSVVKTETYAVNKVDMAAALSTAVPGKPGLSLITCTGRYNTENGYDHRVIAFAVLD